MDARTSRQGALPTVITIGAMKAGTSALHRYLDRHPDIAMAEAKELNFFFGPSTLTAHQEAWRVGTWSLGTDWYASQFDAGAPVRGESSPGYTSPAHPQVAERMAALVPDVRLLYLVRDPVDRAVSQYRHHRRDGTEHRPMAEALLDPASQYLSRGRYAERLAPFLDCFPSDRILVVATEDLLARRRETLAVVYSFLGVDDTFWSAELERRWHTGDDDHPAVDPALRQRLAEALHDDAEQLRSLTGLDTGGWTV